MRAAVNSPPDLTYVTTSATFCTVLRDGEDAYYVLVVEGEGVALVQPAGSRGWAQVALDELDLADTDDLDDVVAATIDAAFEQHR